MNTIMLIKLKLITAIIGVNLLSYHTDKKEVIILDSFPTKNASLPELMEYYNFKIIDKDSIYLNHPDISIESFMLKNPTTFGI